MGSRLRLAGDGGRRRRRSTSSTSPTRSTSSPRTACRDEMIAYGEQAARARAEGDHRGRRRRRPPARHARLGHPAAGHRRAGAAEVPRRHGLAAVHRADAGRRPGRDRLGRQRAQRRPARGAHPRRRRRRAPGSPCASGWSTSRPSSTRWPPPRVRRSRTRSDRSVADDPRVRAAGPATRSRGSGP